MAVFNEPTKWQTSLVNSGDANTIPQTTPAGTGEASFEEGFPQITQVPIGAGGQAPDRKDFNGLFKVLGDWIFFLQNGGLSTYSANFDYVVGRYVVYNNTLYKCIQANGASSTVVAPDSVSPLGSDYWTQVATLADFANFANTDLSNLSATGQALFTNKADKDFSNVTAPTQAFKDMSIGWGMPDWDSKIAQTAGITYTASVNGFITAFNFSNATADVIINGTTYSYQSGNSSSIYTGASFFIPISKGDTYSVTASSNYFYFIPCKGAN